LLTGLFFKEEKSLFHVRKKLRLLQCSE